MIIMENTVDTIQDKLNSILIDSSEVLQEGTEQDKAVFDNGAEDTEKKKKKKKKSKAKKADVQVEPVIEQTYPPTIPINKQFINNKYPHGELTDYKDNYKRSTTAALIYDPNELPNTINDLRRAAEVHRQVRKYAKSIIKPGMDLTDVANEIENTTRKLVDAKGLKSGIGFPTGLSRNHCAAHYTPNAGDSVIIKEQDVLKVDFGVHVNGRIIDSAFTMTWDNKYDKLLEAVKESTNTGIRNAGVDARLCDIGASIQEVMESYEITLNGKDIPIKPVRNLCGHNIGHYVIHGGKSVPIVDNGDQTKMEEGELYACETFGSTGKGLIFQDGVCSHYALNNEYSKETLTSMANNSKIAKAKSLFNVIEKNFSTLPFCRRYLDRIGETKYYLGLKTLVDHNIVKDYPPLVDVEGSYVAQFEHTFMLKPFGKEIFSRGSDY